MKYTTENMFSRRWNAAYKSGTDQQQKCLNLINNLWCLFRYKLPNAIETDTEVCGLDRNVFNKPSHMMLAFEVYPNEALLGVKDFFTVVVSPDGSMELDNLITGSTIKSSLSNQKEVISELRDIKNEFIRTYGRTEKFGESKKHTCSMQKKIESVGKKSEILTSLEPRFDSRKSFYGKAQVEDDGNSKTLYSYNTPVARVIDGKLELLPKWNFSQTTRRHVADFVKQMGVEDQYLKLKKGESKKHTCSMQKKIESFKKNESAGTSFYDEFIADRAREILEEYDVNEAQGGDAWMELNNGDVLDIDREDYSGFISFNDGGVRKQWFASMFSINGQGVGDEKADKYYDILWHSCVADYEDYCKKNGVACDTDSEDFYDYEEEWFSDEYCDIFADAEIWLYSGDRGSFGDRGTYTLHCRINRSFNHNGINPEDDLDVFMKLDASQLTQENADKFFAAVEDAFANYSFSQGDKEINVKAD